MSSEKNKKCYRCDKTAVGVEHAPASQGDVAVFNDKVTLSPNGSVSLATLRDGYSTWDTQVSFAAGSNGRVNNFNGSEFYSKRTSGTFIGASANFAFIGGLGISAGFVTDATMHTAPYFTFNGNLGFGAGIGLDVGVATPTGNGQFNTDQFSGKSGSYSAGVTTPVIGFSYAKGGSLSPTIGGSATMNSNNFGLNPGGYTTSQPSISPRGGFSAGTMF